MVRIRADKNALNPIILATRKDLEALLLGDDACLLLHGWRYSMVGQELQAILQGQLTFSVVDNQLSLSRVDVKESIETIV